MLLHCSCRNGTGTSCWCRSSEHARGCCSCNCRPQQQTVRTQSATKKSGSTQQATSWHPCSTKRKSHRWSGHACRCRRHLLYGNASVREERLQHLNTIFFGDSGRAPCGCCTERCLSEVMVMMMRTCHSTSCFCLFTDWKAASCSKPARRKYLPVQMGLPVNEHLRALAVTAAVTDKRFLAGSTQPPSGPCPSPQEVCLRPPLANDADDSSQRLYWLLLPCPALKASLSPLPRPHPLPWCKLQRPSLPTTKYSTHLSSALTRHSYR